MITEPTVPAEGFSIEDIKELMDGFDPASLLPELDTVFGKVELICRILVMVGPLLLLALGLIYLFLTPKEANHYIGYRCYFGMGSVEAWRYTQRLAGILLSGTGLVLTLIMLFLSAGFSGMNPEDMVWKALWCLVWEAALAAIVNGIICGLAAATFDRKGEYRKKK